MVDPVLVELNPDSHPGLALMSDGKHLQFPAGTQFVKENWDNKQGLRITPPKGVAGDSFVLIQGATLGAVKGAIARCGG